MSNKSKFKIGFLTMPFDMMFSGPTLEVAGGREVHVISEALVPRLPSPLILTVNLKKKKISPLFFCSNRGTR